VRVESGSSDGSAPKFAGGVWAQRHPWETAYQAEWPWALHWADSSDSLWSPPVLTADAVFRDAQPHSRFRVGKIQGLGKRATM
jgi:hypothetical protein